MSLCGGPAGDADLDRAIGLATGGTGGFEVDGGEAGLIYEKHGGG